MKSSCSYYEINKLNLYRLSGNFPKNVIFSNYYLYKYDIIQKKFNSTTTVSVWGQSFLNSSLSSPLMSMFRNIANNPNKVMTPSITSQRLNNHIVNNSPLLLKEPNDKSANFIL